MMGMYLFNIQCHNGIMPVFYGINSINFFNRISTAFKHVLISLAYLCSPQDTIALSMVNEMDNSKFPSIILVHAFEMIPIELIDIKNSFDRAFGASANSIQPNT